MKKLFILLFFIGAPLFAEFDPVAVYLTWQSRPDTTMTVQWLTDPAQQENQVEYQRLGETGWKSLKGSHAVLPGHTPFLIHRTELTGLLPDSDYRFRIGSDGVIYRFRTMPATMIAPIRFVVGGDVYHDNWELLEKMNREVAALDPQFILFGGDLVYNEKAPSHFKGMPRWVEWLIACKKQLVTHAGRLIPIVPAIGNHDVENENYFAALFPMPGAQSFNVLDFGNYLSVILLDTGHLHPIEGAQTEWLKTALAERQTVSHKLALYHVPAYPCYRDYNNKESAQVRKHWVPLFEQGGLNMAFENHDHAYKRTWPLREDKSDPTGVLYFGDGGWAVKEARIPHKGWYLAKSEASRNAILVILHGNERHFIAFDEQGKILDEYFTSPLLQPAAQSAHAQ